jgi:methylglutaconyl-CoA hydratase
MSENGYVNVEISNSIAKIEFYHPQSNSLPSNILSKLADTVTQVSNDQSVNVIILMSAGRKAFCAGASFDELISIEDFPTGKMFFMGFANVINAMRKSPKIIIVSVQGKAVGGGVGLISAADYCFATKDCSVKLSELALGIGPFVVGPAVERKIGKSAFAQMSIDYDWYDADWAFSKGLYNFIYDDIDLMHDAVENLALKLSNSSPEAMAELKKVIWEGTENWDELLPQRAEISGRLVLSDFTKKFIQDFKSKQK